MNFVILAPDYRENSAGVVVLHKLCHKLNEAGHPCSVPTYVRNPHFQYSEVPLRLPPHSINLIVPDITHSGPYRGRVQRVIRYALNTPRFFNVGDADFEHDDVIFRYHESFYHRGCTFFLTSTNTSMFHYDGRPKTNDTAYYIGKGKQEVSVDGVEITLTYPTDRSKLADLLQCTRTFRSFDRNTALNNEAVLAGCEVFVWDGSWVRFNGTSLDTSEKRDDDISIFIDEVMRNPKR